MSQRACCSLVALGGVDRHAVEQRDHHALRFLGGLGDLLAGLAGLQLGPRQLDAARALGRGAQLLEPVAQARPRTRSRRGCSARRPRCARQNSPRGWLASRPSSSCGFTAAVGYRRCRLQAQILAHLDRPFERAPARRRRAQLLLAREAVELLEILQRVASRRSRAASAARSCASRRTARRAGSCRARSRASHSGPTAA